MSEQAILTFMGFALVCTLLALSVSWALMLWSVRVAAMFAGALSLLGTVIVLYYSFFLKGDAIRIDVVTVFPGLQMGWVIALVLAAVAAWRQRHGRPPNVTRLTAMLVSGLFPLLGTLEFILGDSPREPLGIVHAFKKRVIPLPFLLLALPGAWLCFLILAANAAWPRSAKGSAIDFSATEDRRPLPEVQKLLSETDDGR